ncbi:MAG TPA: hypothetical protein VK548_17585 [Candidatus Acidoferrum sp.]|nr:hypothetical protein [Candidatus Acidoferrum sp.]
MSDSYETERQQYVGRFNAGMPKEVTKRDWSLADFHRLRDQRLRALIAHAKANSPWHGERLSGVEPEDVTAETFHELPTMTKDDVMAHWDEIVCDRRLTLAVAEQTLERATSGEPSFALSAYHIVTTSGSSGRRGVFAWDAPGMVSGVLVARRAFKWAEQAAGRVPPPLRPAYVQSAFPGTLSAAVGRCFAGPNAPGVYLWPWTPLPEMVQTLEQYQPTRLVGFPTLLHALALEALGGRVHIKPELIQCQTEPLRPETRAVLEEAFGALVMNVYGSSESMNLAVGYPDDDALYLGEDNAVLEPVDLAGRLVPSGTRSDKLLLTNVINHILPLIRYELNDEVIFLDPGTHPGKWPGRRIEVSGRHGDAFHYGDRVVLPYAFRSAIAPAGVTEYQVRQTVRGADIDVRVGRPANLEVIAERVREALTSAGVEEPIVAVQAVTAVPRLADSGKLRWFVPLPA